MKKTLILFLLLALVVCCQNSNELFNDKYIPGMVAHNCTESEQKAVASAQSFITGLQGVTRGSSTREVESVFAWLSKQTDTHTRSESTSCLDTAFFVVNFKDNKGFVLVPSDSENGKILAFVEEGHLTPIDNIDNPSFEYFLELAESYQLAYDIPTPEPPDTSNMHSNDHMPFDGPIQEFMYRYWSIDTLYSPLLMTKWGQRTPFNDNCPLIGNQHALAGCAAVAIGQIAAYHRSPYSYSSHTYQWSEMLSGYHPTSDSGKTSVAQLMSDIGSLVFMNYGLNSSSTTVNKISYCLDAWNYNYEWDLYNYDLCMQEFESGHPILICGYDENHGGHAWVVDGGMIRNFYCVMHSAIGEPPSVMTDQQRLIHCNWGWNGNYNGYFLSDVFNVQQMKMQDNLRYPSDSVSIELNFSRNLSMYHNISPY